LLVRALSFAVLGIDSVPVEVETDITHGLPSYTVVGSPRSGPEATTGSRRRATRTPLPRPEVTVNLPRPICRKDGFASSTADRPSRCSPPRASCRRGAGGWVIAGNFPSTARSFRSAGLLQAILARNLGSRGHHPFDNGDERVGARDPGGSSPDRYGRRPPALRAEILGEGADVGFRDTPASNSPPRSTRARSLGRGRSTDGAPGPRDRSGRVPRDASRGAAGVTKTMLAERLRYPPVAWHRGALRRRDAHLRSGGEPPWPALFLRRPFRSRRSPSITAAGLLGRKPVSTAGS